MASIQQSMNQLLGAAMGAATAGSYIYRQTPEYQAGKLDKEAQKITEQRNALINERTEKLASGAIAAGGLSDKALQKSEVELRDLQKETMKKAFEIAPTAERARGIMRINRGEVARAEAEAAGLSRVETQALTHREMFEALLARKEMLSAKEHGQLDTMYHRHLKKGDID